MATRQVFIVWSYPLFYESIRRLLEDEEIQVVGANSDLAKARTEIEALQPDTIIIEHGEDEPAASGEVLQLIETSHWGPRIIGVSLRDNKLWVYHSEQRLVKQASDLLDLIRSQ